MQLQDMPPEVLVQIMHFVPLKHRLQRCALVSTAWAKAAAAATTSISQLGISTGRCADVFAWVAGMSVN